MPREGATFFAVSTKEPSDSADLGRSTKILCQVYGPTALPENLVIVDFFFLFDVDSCHVKDVKNTAEQGPPLCPRVCRAVGT